MCYEVTLPKEMYTTIYASPGHMIMIDAECWFSWGIFKCLSVWLAGHICACHLCCPCLFLSSVLSSLPFPSCSVFFDELQILIWVMCVMLILYDFFPCLFLFMHLRSSNVSFVLAILKRFSYWCYNNGLLLIVQYKIRDTRFI